VVNAGEGPVALSIEGPELAGCQLVTALATREPADELGGTMVGGDGRLALVVPARYGAVLRPA
jgi:hypothetical protein